MQSRSENVRVLKDHRLLWYAGLFAVAGMLALGGCKSSRHPANNQAAQPQNPQKATGEQAAPGGSTTVAPGSSAETEAAPPPPPEPSPATLEIPAGVRLHVRLDQDLGSKISETGDSFRATLADDVVVNGTVVIPRGAHAEGRVIDAKPLGRFKGAARLELRLERVRTNRGSYPVSTSTIERVEAGKGGRTAGFAGGGGGFGALIGGLAGGGKGAVIGALAGAGAGAGGSAMTGNKEIVLPAESLITFRLERSVHLTE